MIVYFHPSDKELIKSNIARPNNTIKEFGKLIELIGEDYIDADTTAQNSLFLKLPTSFQGQSKLEIKNNDVANALKSLWDTMLADYDIAFKKGKEEGKNLLLSLNNGDITLDEFEKK